jgi:GDP-mannose 6-dehydrogenase
MLKANLEYKNNIKDIDTISIGIIGLGVLGTAVRETFESFSNIIIKCYDKYKKNSFTNSISINCDSIEELCNCKIIFLCLPTEFCNDKKEYNKTEIEVVCEQLALFNYKGVIILKSTVEPKTTQNISIKYKKINPYFNIVHSPEFLSAKTAKEDFKNQKHIVIGIVDFDIVNKKTDSDNIKYNTIHYLTDFFEYYFPKAKISICSTNESESMKIICNSFYATKIQFFTEIKLLCDKMDIDYNNIKDLMLQNGWINPIHTQIPGHDGEISFGGKCLPKDIKALNEVFKKMNVLHKVIDAVVEENIEMRGNL